MGSLVKNDNHITIHGWMVNELGLSGNDLLVYAIIYGFSQDGESVFYGSRQYLADWCNSTVRGIQKNLNNLIDLGLIEQTEVKIGSYVKYKANRVGTKFTGEQSSLVPVNKVHTPSEQSSRDSINNKIELKDNNIILKNNTAEQSLNNDTFNNTQVSKRNIPLINDIEEKEYKEEKPKRLNLYEKCMLEIDNFTQDERLKESLKEYLSIRLKMKDKPILGVGQWKGLLKTLKSLDGDKVKIVDRALERGWASFYTLNDYRTGTGKPNKAIFGESEEMSIVLPNEVEGGEFSGHVF